MSISGQTLLTPAHAPMVTTWVTIFPPDVQLPCPGDTIKNFSQYAGAVLDATCYHPLVDLATGKQEGADAWGQRLVEAGRCLIAGEVDDRYDRLKGVLDDPHDRYDRLKGVLDDPHDRLKGVLDGETWVVVFFNLQEWFLLAI